jgi:hypothetical protein
MTARMLPVLVALPLVAAYGAAEGVWTNRWHQSHDLERAAARLADVPMLVGDWNGAALTLDERALERAEVQGYLLRRYTHRPTGAEVSVLLVCGRPGPVAVHPPDVCYGGAGYDLTAPPARARCATEAPARPAEFWQATFQKTEAPAPERLAIRWAWSADGEWTAADHPRLRFARSPALYKLYVLRSLPPGDAAAATDPADDFLALFLPHVQQALFDPPAP